jgi:p-cumate 2,3-dioxygenase subunit alpha
MANTPYQSRYLQIDPENRSFLVHRDAYRSPDVFELEKEKVLYKSWIILGHESEIAKPGDFVTRTIVDKDILFNRDRKGEVHAFFNSCRHRGPAVARDKKGNRKSFVCPYHGWVYRDDGQLLTTGSDASDATFPPGFCEKTALVPVPRLESHAGFYFINFDPEAEDLLTFLDGSADRLQLIADQSAESMEVIRGCHEYEINANYKLLCENSYDGSHLGPVHESYIEYMMDVMKGSGMKLDTSGQALSFGHGHACFEIVIKAGRAVAQWIPSMGEAVKEEVEAKKREVIGRLGEERGSIVCETHRNMVIFPNSIINDQQSVLVRSIVPLSHNRMMVRAWTLGPSDESAALREVRLMNMLSFLGPGGFATPDDVAMLELAQRGYEATNVEWNDFSKGYTAEEKTERDGVADVNDELQMRAYWIEWDRKMNA